VVSEHFCLLTYLLFSIAVFRNDISCGTLLFSLTFILQSDLFIILIEVQKCKEICVKVVKFIMVDPVGFKMSTQVNWWQILTFFIPCFDSIIQCNQIIILKCLCTQGNNVFLDKTSLCKVVSKSVTLHSAMLLEQAKLTK